MTSKQRSAPAQEQQQTRYRVRIAFEGVLVGDEFTMDPSDPYVKGLLRAGLVEEVPADEAERVRAAHVSRLQAPDASADPQVRADVSGEPAGAEPHVTPAPDDTSSPPADATP